MEKKRKNRILLLVLAALLGILLTGCSSGRKLDPTEYVHLELSGLNGQGKGKVVLDGEAIIKVIEEKKDLTTRNREDLEVLLIDLQKDFSMSKSEELSNGDTVTVKSDMDKKALKDYGISIKNGSVDLTVEGLIDLTQISLNDYISTQFTGFEGYGEAYVSLDRDALIQRIGEIAASVAGQEEADIFLENGVYDYLSGITLSQSYFDTLSEGQEIICGIEVEKSLIEQFGIEFVASDYTAKTQGLIPVTTINMMDYVLLEAEGFDGHAWARTYIDQDSLAAYLEPIFKEQGRGTYGLIEENGSLEEEAFTSAEYITQRFSERFERILDQSEDLCEEDLVTCSAQLRADSEAYVGCGFVLEGGEKEFTVEGLTPTIQIDLPDYTEAYYEGFEEYGTASVTVDYDAIYQYVKEQFSSLGRGAYELADEDTDYDEEVDECFYSIESMIQYDFISSITPDENLVNGDKVTVSWSLEEGVSGYLDDYGIYFEGGTKELSVEGLVPVVTVEIPQYVKCSFSGYNGAGTYELTIDEEGLKDYLKEQFTSLGRGAYGMAVSDTDYDVEAENAAERVLSMIDYNYEGEYPENLPNLSNGDQIEAAFTLREDYSDYDEYAGIYVTGGETSFTVEGLTQPKEIDLADYVTVAFSGVTPDVTVERQVHESGVLSQNTSLYEDYDNSIYAWNGDVYSFDIAYDAQAVLETGYVVTNAHVETTISGLNTYKLSAQGADDESITALWDAFEEEAETTIRSNGSRALDHHGNVGLWIVWPQSRLVRERAQFQYVSSEEAGTRNGLYLVYRYDAVEKAVDHSVQVYPVWYVVRMRNVQETPDGEILYDGNDGTVFYTEQEVNDYLAGEQQNLSENASVEDLLFQEDAPELQAMADEQIGVNTSAPAAPAAGQIDGSALSQAAAVIEWEGHTYARYDTILPWKQAEAFCLQAGAHLATIRSDREALVIRALTEEAPLYEYYLGGTDEAYEGAWTWSDEEPFDYDGWANNQPDNHISDGKDEDYLTLSRNNSWKFNDAADNVEAGFILEADPTEDTECTYLTDLEASHLYYAGFQERVTDHFGSDHFGSLYLDASNRGSAFYDLNGEWARLTGTISTFADAQTDALFEIVIWGDDQILFSRYGYKKTDVPMNLDLDLTGVQKLSIETNNRGGYGNGFLFLNDAKLMTNEAAQDDGAASEQNTEKGAKVCAGLKDLPEIGSASMDRYTEKGLPTDALGSAHRDAWIFVCRDNAQAAWYLGGHYDSFRCLILAQDDYGDISSANAMILGDGRELWSTSELTIVDGYQEVAVDVTGVQVLEVVTSSSSENGRPLLFAADTWLTGSSIGEDADSSMQGDGTTEEADGSVEGAGTAGADGSAGEAGTADVDSSAAETGAAADTAALLLNSAAAVIRAEEKTFYRFDEPVNRRTALQYAQNAGASLANPATEIEETAFQKLMDGSIYYDYWMGSTDHSYAMSTDDPNTKTGFVLEKTDQEWKNTIAGSCFLTDLEWEASENIEACDVYKGKQVLYPNSIWIYTNRRGYLIADLHGQYEKLESSMGMYTENGTNSSIQFAVFGDGKLLCEVRNINKSFTDKDLSIDVSGVHKLQICAINTGKDETAELALRTPRLYPSGSGSVAETETIYKVPDRLKDLTLVDSSDYEQDRYIMVDGYGFLSDCRQVFNADRSAHALYNLEGKYTTFAGCITSGRDTDLYDSARVTILADGQEVFDTGMWKATDGPVEFEIDVTGALTLELRTESANPDRGKMNVYLTGDQLLK